MLEATLSPGLAHVVSESETWLWNKCSRVETQASETVWQKLESLHILASLAECFVHQKHSGKNWNEVSMFRFDSIKQKIFYFCNLKGFSPPNFVHFSLGKNIQNPRKRFSPSPNKRFFSCFFKNSCSSAAGSSTGRRMSCIYFFILPPSSHHSASGTDSTYVL